MRQELSRENVYGFLRAEGRELRNERGDKIQLLGWGLGNWLVPEGYMLGYDGAPRFDRPRMIEKTIRELTGERYADRFWRQYRAGYVTEEDLRLMVELGCNSLRLPMNARLLMAEGENEIRFLENGFELIDRLLDACEKHGLYVWLDLHAAPGGQTGANIDDSQDDVCRLFIDHDQFNRGLALWEEIARRYHDRWIVAGYDLLNEPIRPVRFPGDMNLDGYAPRLKEFYEQAISRIRAVDPRHLIALEGIHWATDLSIFDHKYDDQMVIHFHRYCCPPEMDSLKAYLELSERLDAPLWLGETGENTNPWLAALVPLALEAGIQVTLWPWKKMGADNAPCVIQPPENWNLLGDYLEKREILDPDSAQRMLDSLLENIRVENCKVNRRIASYALRTPVCEIQGTDFDELPGAETSWHAEGSYEPGVYRRSTGMEILPGVPEKAFPFDGPWREAELRLHAGEWAEYTFWDVTASCSLEIACAAEEPGRIEVTYRDRVVGSFDISGCSVEQVLAGMHMVTMERCTIRVKVLEGAVRIRRLRVYSLPAI